MGRSKSKTLPNQLGSLACQAGAGLQMAQLAASTALPSWPPPTAGACSAPPPSKMPAELTMQYKSACKLLVAALRVLTHLGHQSTLLGQGTTRKLRQR